jgi:hypothetical protein
VLPVFLPIDSYFVKSTGVNFSLALDTVASTIDTINYQMEFTGVVSVFVGNEIILLDVAQDVSMTATIVSIVGNTVTVDRPINYVFAAATTIGRVITSEMAVVGSLASPQIYTVRAGTKPVYLCRMLLTMVHATAADDSLFGNLPALTNGLILRIFDGIKENIFNFKTNGEIKQFCYDVTYSDKAGAGLFGTSARMTINGPSHHATALRFSGANAAAQWIVQDDLTGLNSLKCSTQGSERPN